MDILSKIRSHVKYIRYMTIRRERTQSENFYYEAFTKTDQPILLTFSKN